MLLLSKGIISRAVSSPFGVELSLTVFGNAPSPRPRERRRRACATKAAPGASSAFRENSVPSQGLAKTMVSLGAKERVVADSGKALLMGGDGFPGGKLRFPGRKLTISRREVDNF